MKKMDKLLLGGIVLLIHSIEQMSLARGRLVYCNYIGKELSIECKVTLLRLAKPDISAVL